MHWLESLDFGFGSFLLARFAIPGLSGRLHCMAWSLGWISGWACLRIRIVLFGILASGFGVHTQVPECNAVALQQIPSLGEFDVV